MQWIKQGKEMIILNGLVTKDKSFDSKFTFYRGNLRSQNDVILANEMENINNLNIMEKNIYSDHCPIAISCSILGVGYTGSNFTNFLATIWGQVLLMTFHI